jgi:hypothetical protein
MNLYSHKKFKIMHFKTRSSNQHWFSIIYFFNTIQVLIMRISHHLIQVRYENMTVLLFSIPFKFIYLAKTLIARQYRWFRMVLTQNHNSTIQRVFHFHRLTKHQYSTCITTWIPMGKFLDTLIDVDYWYHATVTYMYTRPTLVWT